MTRFIELNDHDGRPTLFSESQIVRIYPHAQGGCYVETPDGFTPVQQSYEKIHNAIINARPDAPIITVEI